MDQPIPPAILNLYFSARASFEREEAVKVIRAQLLTDLMAVSTRPFKCGMVICEGVLDSSWDQPSERYIGGGVTEVRKGDTVVFRATDKEDLGPFRAYYRQQGDAIWVLIVQLTHLQQNPA